eukprot:gene19735-biopygen44321
MQTCGLDRRGLQDDGDAEVLYKGTIPGEACDFPDPIMRNVEPLETAPRAARAKRTWRRHLPAATLQRLSAWQELLTSAPKGEVYPHPAGVVEAVRHAADAGGGGVHPHPPPAAVQGGADEAKGACITRVAVQCAPDGGVHPHPPGGDIRRVKVMHKGAAHWCTEVLVQGHVLWYTDGASSNNQDSRFRRAGYGAICGWARMEHLSGAGGHWRHQGPDEQQGRTTCGGGGAGTRSATGPPRNRQCICARWGQAEPAAMACARVAAAGCVAEANCQCGPVEAPARTAQCTRAIGAMAESERPRH